MALLMTACAVPGAPPHAAIYPKGHYEFASAAGFALEVDFERHIINVDIQGERYTGKLVWTPEHRGFEAQLLTSNGAKMECFLTQQLADIWRGECNDSQGRVYALEVGHGWSI